MTTAPNPGSPEWQSKITASKVAAILGLSPWDSPYSMWRKMRQDIPGDEQNAAMDRGHMLEDAVLNWWLRDFPEHTEVSRQAWYPLDEWAGATPDLDVTNPDGEPELVDAKTIATDDAWRDGPPPYYLASSLWQLACAPQAKRVHLAVLFGKPFTMRTFTVERDDDLIAHLVRQCRAFYDSLTHWDAPDLDDSVATYEAVRALHPDIDRDATALIDDSLAAEYVAASLAYREAETRDRAARARLLEQMGRARIAVHDGATLARRQPNRSGVSLVRVATTIPTRMEIPA